MSVKALNPTQKRQYINILLVLLISIILMWFGVFKLHIYDTVGVKQKIGALVLGIDWVIISILSFVIVKSYFSSRRLSSYKSLPRFLRSMNLFATVSILAGLLILIATIVYYIFLYFAWKSFTL